MMKHGKLRTTLLAALCCVVIAVEPACLGAEPPKAKRFRDAIRDGNLDLVRSIIADDPSLANGRNYETFSAPLYLAVTFGHANIVRLLLENGAEVNAQDRQALTPLCHARSAEIAKLLLSHGAMFSDLALRKAAENGYVEVVKFFLDAGARVDFNSAVELGLTARVAALLDKEPSLAEPPYKPLHAAAARGHYDVCKLLLERGADPDLDYGFSNILGPYTPLSKAVTEGHYEVAKLLLEHGANPNVSGGRNHENLFLFAIAYLDERFVRLMLEHKVDLQAGEHWVKDTTPLHVAAALGGASDMIHVVRWGQRQAPAKEKSQAIGKVRLLIEAGADINARSADGSTPLLFGALAGHRDVCELLLENGAEIDAASACLLGKQSVVDDMLQANPKLAVEENGPLRRPLLHWAARVGDAALVKRLLDLGADPNSHARRLDYQDAGGFSANEWEPTVGETPLQIAARHGHLDIALLLIEGGAVADEHGDPSHRPLYYAYAGGHTKLVKLLLEKGARFRLKDDEMWWYLAPENIDGAAFKLLLDSMDADELKGDFGTNLLAMAVQEDRRAAAEQLIERGVKPDFVTACTFGRIDDVRAMASANPAIVNSRTNGLPVQSAIALAAQNGHKDVVEFLISQGADTEPSKLGGTTLLHEAAAHGRQGVMQLLLDRGMRLDVKDDHGGSLLHTAAAGEQPEIVRFLLSQGADAAALDFANETPLHRAAECWVHRDGNPDPKIIERAVVTARLLLDAGANVNAREDNGWTPLHEAAESRNVELAELLIDAGAEVNARSDRDETPLAVCQSRRYEAFSSRDSEPLADLLRRHGAVRKLLP